MCVRGRFEREEREVVSRERSFNLELKDAVQRKEDRILIPGQLSFSLFPPCGTVSIFGGCTSLVVSWCLVERTKTISAQAILRVA